MQRPSSWSSALALAGWLALAFAAAAVGGYASADSGGFYRDLVRPAWAPPAWLFGPAWTLLYLLMGVASWLVWQARARPGARAALGLYLAQLAANALWTWLFFAWRLGAAAFAEIVVLLALIVLTMGAFGRVRRLAAWLLAPYLLWVGYATALTWAVWRANPALLG